MSLAIAFDGAVLAESIRRTFSRRGTPIPAGPLSGLSGTFARTPLHANRWRAFLGRMHMGDVASDFAEVVEAIATFAQPALDAARDGAAYRFHWPPGGPWKG